MFDAQTGAIDKTIVQHWMQFDISRMVDSDWEHYGPIIKNKVRLMCGELDSYYLNRAVSRFKTMVETRQDGVVGLGYILLVPNADHGTLTSMVYQRINNEMRAHFQAHGLYE